MHTVFILTALTLAVMVGGIGIRAYQDLKALEEWYEENRDWLEGRHDV